MAKATTQAYRVVGSPLSYNGKTAQPDDVLNDIPGQSISWLLEGGHIVATTDGVTGCSPRKFKAPTGKTIERSTAAPAYLAPEPQPEPEQAPEVESAPSEPEPEQAPEPVEGEEV